MTISADRCRRPCLPFPVRQDEITLVYPEPPKPRYVRLAVDGLTFERASWTGIGRPRRGGRTYASESGARLAAEREPSSGCMRDTCCCAFPNDLTPGASSSPPTGSSSSLVEEAPDAARSTLCLSTRRSRKQRRQWIVTTGMRACAPSREVAKHDSHARLHCHYHMHPTAVRQRELSKRVELAPVRLMVGSRTGDGGPTPVAEKVHPPATGVGQSIADASVVGERPQVAERHGGIALANTGIDPLRAGLTPVEVAPGPGAVSVSVPAIPVCQALFTVDARHRREAIGVTVPDVDVVAVIVDADARGAIVSRRGHAHADRTRNLDTGLALRI